MMCIRILIFASDAMATSTNSNPSASQSVGLKRQRSFDLNEEITPEGSEQTFTSPIQSQIVKEEKCMSVRPYRRRNQRQLTYATEKNKCDHGRSCSH